MKTVRRGLRRLVVFALVVGGLGFLLTVGVGLLFFYFPMPGAVAPIAAGVDVTPRFARYRTADGFDQQSLDTDFAPLAARLRDTLVLVVPSWLADQVVDYRQTGLVDYFNAQQAWLESQGIAVAVAEVQTEASIVENAAWLRDFVRASRRPICFVTHSKGGLDVLEFLIGADPSLRAKVACWIAMQAPFSGAPLADWASDRRVMRFMIAPALRLLGGDIVSLDELRTDRRHAYLERHRKEIAGLAREVPILALATRIDPNAYPIVPGSVVAWSLGQINGAAVDTDGIVPTASSILPYAPYVVMDGLDHGMTVGDVRLDRKWRSFRCCRH